jgi:hypothetical protein
MGVSSQPDSQPADPGESERIFARVTRMPGWSPFVIAIAFAGVAFCLLYPTIREPGDWDFAVRFISGCGLFAFVVAGSVWLLDRFAKKPDLATSGAAILWVFLAVLFLGVTIAARNEIQAEGDWFLLAVLSTFALWFGGVSAASVGILWERPWAERLSERLGNFAALGVMTVITTAMIRDAIGLNGGKATVFDDKPVAAWLMILWIVGTLLLYWAASRERAANGADHTLPACLTPMWPIMVLVLAPSVFGPVLLFLVGFLAGGELLGRQIGHPFLGATFGLLAFIASFSLLISWNSRTIARDSPDD